MSARTYRPEIDGLRAIAVLSVLLHHLNPAYLPGGFIGVDIFFVISGYLITGQIHKDMVAGEFSIAQFYKRRVNRILPALVVVITATLCAGLVILSPMDLTRLTKGALYSILGLPNIFSWREYGNYFAANATEAPLLHLWSLGVEEQFYLVWPLLLLALLKVGRGKALGLLFMLLLASIAVSEVGTRMVASASYYMLPTRFFELMVGGVLALAPARLLPTRPWQGAAAMAAGMASIAASLAWIDRTSPFPGITALWPCLGAAMVIWSGNTPSRLHMLLTNRVMIFFGLISYSLYLWHWPLIALLNYLAVDMTFATEVAIALSATLLAWITWKFIETPMRQSGAKLKTSRALMGRFVVPAVGLALSHVAVASNSGFPARFDPLVARLEAYQRVVPSDLRAGCHVPTALYSTPPSPTCRIGAEKPKADGILLGDSFANHFTGMLDVLAQHEGISLVDYTMDACPPIVGFATRKNPTYVKRCQSRNDMAYAHLAKERFKHVVLAADWPDAEEAGPMLARSIELILKTGAQVTIILQNERIEGGSTCSIRNAMFKRKDACYVRPAERAPYFAEIRRKFPAVQFIDPNTVICPKQQCAPVLDGILLYRDSAHLNDAGSRQLARKLLELGPVHLGFPGAAEH